MSSPNENSNNINIDEKDDNNNNNEIPAEYKSLQCFRIEETRNRVIFLYYKKYPKKNSERFPQNLTIIIFYFDQQLDDKFFYLYMSLFGQIDEVSLGSFFNRHGSKSKRKMVNFAIVKYSEKESVNKLLDNHFECQNTINNYIENKRNKNIKLQYDPLKNNSSDSENDDFNIDDENEEDEDGFVEVKKNTSKNNFSKGNVSFKVIKKKDSNNKNNEDDSSDDDRYVRKKKKKMNDKEFYWNFQMLDKKREMYNELKNLFDEDKKALNKKKMKLK